MDKKNIIIVCVIAIVVGLILALVVSLNFNKSKSDKVDNSSVDEVDQKREETWLHGKRLNKSKDEVFEWVIGLENNNYFL